MKGPTTVDAARAALYALDALPDEQRTAFEERLAASPDLQAEVDAFRAVTADLALAPAPLEPRATVRARLLARVAAGPAEAAMPPALPDLLFSLQADATWITVIPGLEHRALSRDGSSSSYLLRLAPGATIPRHGHGRCEHSFVLSGSVEVAGTLCRAGDYHRAAAGTSHQGSYSAEGCVMLVLETAA